MTTSARKTALLCALLLAGCDRAAPPPPAPEPEALKTVQSGVASFYGREFAGRETASGDTFKLDAMTAASRTLPLGSRVQVVNRETGESAKVTINDRGPYAKGRIIDLTPEAARKVGVDQDDGVAHVDIKTVPAPDRPAPTATAAASAAGG